MKQDGRQGYLEAFQEKMRRHSLPEVAIETFSHYYRQVVAGATGMISDQDIEPVGARDIPRLEQLADFAERGKREISRTVMVVLNGGLGTSMGLTGAKSLLEVKNGLSFLEIILRRAQRLNLRLALMNSFNTHQETLEALQAFGHRVQVDCFLQHKFPKLLQSDLSPARWPQNRHLEWNPPGHGDIYTALQTSQMLPKLLSEGIRYALVINADNLGATLNESLLGYMAAEKIPFIMEVARRTPADMKGGHLAKSKDGRLLLREIAQCPPHEQAAFQDISLYRYFNTNSLWIDLEALQGLVQDQGAVHLPIILNPKHLDPRDPDSPLVYQLETAMGAAIALFDGARAVEVPENRFLPVKKCPDLLAVRSDCYLFDSDLTLVSNPERKLGRIVISLDSNYYGKIDDLEARFRDSVPSLVHCSQLTVAGDVFFRPGVVCRGAVEVKNNTGRPVYLDPGRPLEDEKVVFD